MDIRDTKLSNLLISYSTEIKPGEKVLIEYEGSLLPTPGQSFDPGYLCGRRLALCVYQGL